MHLKYLCVYLSTGKGEFTGESDIGEQHRADALVGAAGLGLDGIACRRNRVAVEGLDHRQVVDLVANGEDLVWAIACCLLISEGMMSTAQRFG